MKVGGSVEAGVGVLVGMVNRIAGRRFCWVASWHFGGVTGRLIGFRLGSGLRGLRGLRGLQLLVTTVISSSSSSSARIWNGLLLRVCRWWINSLSAMDGRDRPLDN